MKRNIEETSDEKGFKMLKQAYKGKFTLPTSEDIWKPKTFPSVELLKQLEEDAREQTTEQIS